MPVCADRNRRVKSELFRGKKERHRLVPIDRPTVKGGKRLGAHSLVSPNRAPGPLGVKVRRALAYPLAVGAEVRMQGRVEECASLIEPGNRLLDIGCSSGWLAPLVLGRGFRSYVGVDRVIAGPGQGVSGTQFVEGSVFGLPFRDNSFDAVSLFDVIEHLPRQTEEHAFREIYRVLKTDGKLYFSTPHASPIHAPLDPVWCLGHRHYRRTTVRRLLQSAGFTIDRIFVAGGVVEGLDHVRLLVYKHLLHRQLPSINLVNRLIERSHGHDRRLGMTIFAVASR
jgi:SAM-dependent methyltransferase